MNKFNPLFGTPMKYRKQSSVKNDEFYEGKLSFVYQLAGPILLTLKSNSANQGKITFGIKVITLEPNFIIL